MSTKLLGDRDSSSVDLDDGGFNVSSEVLRNEKEFSSPSASNVNTKVDAKTHLRQGNPHNEDVIKLDTSGLDLDSEAIELIELLKHQISLLRDKLKQANLEKERLNARVGAHNVIQVTLEEAKRNLRNASKKLLEGDESPETQAAFDKWDKIVSEHPEHIAQLAKEEALFESNQNPINRAAYKLTCGFIPPDIKKCSKADLIDRGLNPGLAKRLFERKSLWLVRMEASLIAKIHIADLRTKYSPQGLDLVEFRAVYYSLPVEFDNDGTGAKMEWRNQIKRKLYSLIKKHEKGDLPLSQVRNPSYIDRTKQIPFPTLLESVPSGTETEEDKTLSLEIEFIAKAIFENRGKGESLSTPKEDNKKTLGQVDRSNLAKVFATRGGKGGGNAPLPYVRGEVCRKSKMSDIQSKLACSLFSPGRGRGRGRGSGGPLVTMENSACEDNRGSSCLAEAKISRPNYVSSKANNNADSCGNSSYQNEGGDKKLGYQAPSTSSVVNKFIDTLKKTQKQKQEEEHRSRMRRMPSPKKLDIGKSFAHRLEKTQSALNMKMRENGKDEIPTDPESMPIPSITDSQASSSVVDTLEDTDTDWECIEHAVGNLHLREQPLEEQLSGLENLMQVILSIAGSNTKSEHRSPSSAPPLSASARIQPSGCFNNGSVESASHPLDNECPYYMTDSVVMVPPAKLDYQNKPLLYPQSRDGVVETCSLEENSAPALQTATKTSNSSPSLITQLRKVIMDISSPISLSPSKSHLDLCAPESKSDPDSCASAEYQDVLVKNVSDSDWLMVKAKESLE